MISTSPNLKPNLAIANAQLEQAQKDYDELIVGADPDDIALAGSPDRRRRTADRHRQQRLLTWAGQPRRRTSQPRQPGPRRHH